MPDRYPTNRQMNNRHRKRSQGKQFLPVLFVLCALLILSVIFYVSGIYTEKKDEAFGSVSSQQVRELLYQMEQAAPADPASWAVEPETPERTDFYDLDLSGIQADIMEHFGDYDYNSQYFRSWFEDSAIIGDSIAEAASGFGWLYEQNLQAQIGISLQTCDEVIEGTKWLQPGTVFLTFSANNIASYGVGIETYIDDYTAVIRDLKESLPDARIFVEGILPCEPGFEEEYWYYAYLDDYNSAMQDMCRELDVYYYDAGFIFYEHPYIFSEDGMHPTWEFYPLWLTYMARIAGLDQ